MKPLPTSTMILLPLLLGTPMGASAQLGPEADESFWQWVQDSHIPEPQTEEELEEGSPYNQRQRLLSFWMPRLYPGGERAQAQQAMQTFQAWRGLNPCDVSLFQADWNGLGPWDTPGAWPTGVDSYVHAKGTGQIHCIAFHPDYPNTPTIYAGSGYGGLFRSTNAGGNWVPLTDFLVPIAAVTDIVIHPNDPNTLFIATGNVDSDGHYSAGVFRSANGGETWQPINTGLLGGFEDLVLMRVLRMDPTDPDHLLCATSQGIFECTNANDAEPTWVPRFSETSGRWKNIVFHPDPAATGTIYASATDVYRSMDNGTTWHSLTDALNFDLSTLHDPGESIARINIAISPFAPEYFLHAWINLVTPTTNGPTYYKYRRMKLDHGSSQPSFLLNPATLTATGLGSPAWIAIATTPAYNGQVALAASRPRYSNDHTETIPLVGAPPTIHDDVHIMVYSPAGDELWIGHDGGISMVPITPAGLTNTSTPWVTKNTGLAVGTIMAIATSPTDPIETLIGNQDEGNNLLRDPGSPEWWIIQGGDGGAVRFAANGRRAWTQQYNNRRYYRKWELPQVTSPQLILYDCEFGCTGSCICGAHGATTIPPFVIHPETGKWHICSTDCWHENNSDVFPSNNSFYTRTTHLNDDMLYEHNLPFGQNIVWFDQECVGRGFLRYVFAPSDPNKVYLSTAPKVPDADCPDGGRPALFRSLPDPVTGILPPVGMPPPQRFEECSMPNAWNTDQKPIMALDANPNDPDHIVIGFSGYNADLKVFESWDRGTTWINMDPDHTLPNLPVNDLVFHHGTNSGVYIAMDIGVYYRNADSGWQPFCQGLPNVIVSDIEINYCAGKLRAGTYGRGLWESSLAEQPSVALDLAGEVTWDGHKNVFQSIRVLSGSSLTITGTVNFAAETALIIEPGAQVIVDGGLLTNLCGKPWAGVQVLGNAAMSQAPGNQGYLSLVNGAIIENATTAVLVGDMDDLDKGGGEVRITGTDTQAGGTVRSCHTGIYFRPYVHYPFPGQLPGYVANNRSLFQHARFEFDGTGPFGEQGLNAHMVMDGVNNVLFEGCLFENSAQDVAESHLLGHGIKAIASRFRVRSACATPPTGCAPSQKVPTVFRGLDHGIHALGTFYASSASVYDCIFENNVCGLYNNGVPGFQVYRNTFEMGERAVTLIGDVDEAFLDRHRGIFFTEAYAFRMQDNTLGMADPYLTEAEGIVAGYVRDHNDVVFRNSATGVSNAFVGEGVSASLTATESIGLQFHCNSNDENPTNIWSRKVDGAVDEEQHSIRSYQGSPRLSVNNGLDQWEDVPDHWDVKVNTLFSPITYFHHDAANYPPVTYSPTLLPVVVNPLMGSACGRIHVEPDPPSQMAGVFHAELETARTEYGNTRYLYEQLIDDGNTDEVVQEIMAAWPQDVWDLRAYLLARSPYLSVEALWQLVNKQGVPEAIKAEICIANPEGTQQEGFVPRLQQFELLPEYLIGAIVASWDARTFRTALLGDMAEQHFTMTQAANALMGLYCTGDSSGVNGDSLLYTWQRIRTPAARYAEAVLLLSANDPMAAQAVIEGIPQEHKLRQRELDERGRMLAVLALLQTLEQDGRGYRGMSAGEVAGAEALIAGHYDRPSTWMSNLLCFHYARCRPPMTGGGDESPKSLPRHTEADRLHPIKPLLHIHPNPANTWVAFDYDLLVPPKDASLVVRDLTGRTVYRQVLREQQQQLVWDTRQTAPGTYTATLLSGGRALRTEKLILKP